jgi:hypothetical protein
LEQGLPPSASTCAASATAEGHWKAFLCMTLPQT